MSIQVETVKHVSRIDGRLKALERREPRSGALGDATAAYLSLPGLVAFWPCSVTNANSGDLIDIAGGFNMTRNGDITFGNEGVAPIVTSDGTTDYFSVAHTAELDVLGSETFLDNPGLTVGAWCKETDWGGGVIFGKGNTSDQWAITSQIDSSLAWFALEPVGGGADLGASIAHAAFGDWHFYAGRFTPSSEIKLWRDTATATNTTSIPASIAANAANLSVLAENDGSNCVVGSGSMFFICAGAVPDATIDELYQVTRGLFGV